MEFFDSYSKRGDSFLNMKKMENILYAENFIINDKTYDMKVIECIDGVKGILSKNGENLFYETITVDRNEVIEHIKQEGFSPMNDIFKSFKEFFISKILNWKIINEVNL